MGIAKPYSLRTRDMYHPLYSTYQLDYLRPNVWEIVIGTSSPADFLGTNGNYVSAGLGTGNRQRNVNQTYQSEGAQPTTTFNSQASAGLSLYCSKFSLNLPKSNVITVDWISGVSKLAGRNTEGFSITAEFYAGLGAKSTNYVKNGLYTDMGSAVATDDILRLLYAWRNLCFDARTGQIGLAPSYKKPATIFMYDPSGVKIIYEFTVQGLWPSSINTIELDVAGNEIVKLSCEMHADFVYMADEGKATDDFYNYNLDNQAGGSTLKGSSDTNILGNKYNQTMI